MRIAFWRRNTDNTAKASAPSRVSSTAATSAAAIETAAAPAQKPAIRQAIFKRPPTRTVQIDKPAPLPPDGDIDVRLIGQALARKKHLIIAPTLLALVVSLAIVNLITPRYKSEARILIDGRENTFLRPSGDRDEQRSGPDPEAVTSQVQLLLSRQLALEIIKKNKLAERPEFDPVLKGINPIKSLLALIGIGRDPFAMTPEERVLNAYYERLTAYAVDKSRVMVVEFQSEDPELAARVANSIADGYLVLQQNARQAQAKAAGQWLSGEIESLRKKVAEAEDKVEDFRSKSSLFIGTNNTTLSNQQLGDINAQLANARALKSDAEAKSRLIKEMLKSGGPIEASEVLNSELIRRLSEQRVTLRAQLAEQSSTLLGGHPRIKELKAQLSDLDQQLRDEAVKLSRSFENDARIASSRVENLSASLDQLKKQASATNGQDVQLRALEREAKAQRDLLESYLAKYREATTRETIDQSPSDGRIISRAIVSNTPDYPKKLPIVLIATLATLLLTSGSIATGELLRMTQPRAREVAAPAVVEPDLVPVAAAAPVVRPAPAPPTFAAAATPAPILEQAPVETAPVAAAASAAAAAPVGEIEALVQRLRTAGEGGRKLTVLGTGDTDSVTTTALVLARRLAQDAKVVLIDLSESSAMLKVASIDPSAPGLAELMLGEAAFGQIITRDRSSSLQLVSAGKPGFDRMLLHSPRLSLAIDALMRVYDHVLLDAGTASDLPAELLTSQAQAAVVPAPTMTSEARAKMAEQLVAVGFSEVTMLRAAEPIDPIEPGQRSAAA
ncbi:exopolysaccharide transport family protein [Rhodopseudomonas palustris]|uniref:Exopolysaccharide transport family protein n=1 Tax=Rhodopseudomonas palustris TaxID=1076 RepID=A0AAX3DST6_RHOPL|nr:exopolysaccharide transport family protein [Rhodopseudomonas palustris]UYO37799.1 exopolysaccharide transport family protein [Rhodopseudomonas palustris]